MRYLVPIALVTAVLFAGDLYVFRNWRRFVRGTSLGWTLVAYRVLMVVMPFTLPLYFYLYSWWEVEPRLARALFFAIWTLYYLPKLPIVAVLLAKDLGRLGQWSYRRYLQPADREARETGHAISRTEFVRRLGWSAAAIPVIATGYGIYRTLYDFAVHRVDVPIAGLPRQFEGLTIAQLSDVHAGSLFGEEPMWEAVSIVNDLQPDLIALTGDFVNHETVEMERVTPALKALQSVMGTYGCLGNHDHYADTNALAGRVRSTGIDLLVNAHRTFEIDGAQLYLIGTDNTGFNQHYADLPKAIEGIPTEGDQVRILLAHDPTYWDGEVLPNHDDIALMLCGHTHGGQLGIELGPFRWSLAQMRYERWAGLYSEPGAHGPRHLYVNRGIGTVGPPLRLGIRPEVTLLTLRRA